MSSPFVMFSNFRKSKIFHNSQGHPYCVLALREGKKLTKNVMPPCCIGVGKTKTCRNIKFYEKGRFNKILSDLHKPFTVNYCKAILNYIFDLLRSHQKFRLCFETLFRIFVIFETVGTIQYYIID